jgi:hypothetical protein
VPQPKTLVLKVFDFLVGEPESHADRIAAGLQMEKTKVNSVLYGNPRLFIATPEQKPHWSARSLTRRKAASLAGEK